MLAELLIGIIAEPIGILIVDGCSAIKYDIEVKVNHKRMLEMRKRIEDQAKEMSEQKESNCLIEKELDSIKELKKIEDILKKRGY